MDKKIQTIKKLVKKVLNKTCVLFDLAYLKIKNQLVTRFYKFKNKYYYTNSKKRFILVSILVAVLASPIIPGGPVTCPIATKLLLH